MGSVYESAHHTVIFLGPGTHYSDELFQCILSKKVPYFLLEDQGTKEHWKGMLIDVLARPWFGRVWILQELVLSGDPWIQCGTSRIKWDRFHDFLMSSWLLRENFPDLLAPPLDMNTIRTAYKTSVPAQQPEGEALLAVLKARRGLGATDVKDLIYAHLGLMSSQTREVFKVDYGKSCCGIYTEIARQLMVWLPSLDIISLSDFPKLSSKVEGLPSWVPDWSVSLNPVQEEIAFQLSVKFPTPHWAGVKDYDILHASSQLLLASHVRRSVVAHIVPPIDRADLCGLPWMPKVIPPENLRIRMPGTNNLWELYEDAKHYQIMLSIFKKMLGQKFSSQAVDEIMDTATPGLSKLHSIAATIQSSDLWELLSRPNTRREGRFVIDDMLLMLLLIARLYLSGANVAMMTDGSAMVVPSCVKKDDQCIFLVRQPYVESKELDVNSWRRKRPEFTYLNMHSCHTTFIRNDHDYHFTPADLMSIKNLGQTITDLDLRRRHPCSNC